MAIVTEPAFTQEPRESALSRVLLSLFLKSAPPSAMRMVRRRMPEAPLEELVIRGRRTGRERRMLLGFFDVDGGWYVGHPNGTSQWVRNLEAAGGCTVIRRDGIPIEVRAAEVTSGPERDAVIRATAKQPFPAANVYRRTQRHIRAVGRYFRLEPVARTPD